MDIEKAGKLIDSLWTDSIVDELVEYVRIPAKSPDFDPDWAANGYIDEAVEQVAAWCRKQDLGEVEVVRLQGRTPVILIEIPGELDDTVLLYGHLDKQPEMSGWADDLGPWKPVIKDDKLYGRGGADDGYAAYASLAAIKALKEQRVPHARMVVLIETCEESASYDLPHYIEHLSDRIGEPSLVVCLDSGAGNYEQLWMTVSLRGMVSGTLRVDILDEGIHSGGGSGIAPSSFRIARHLLDRLEDPATGRILPDALTDDIPEQRREQLAQVAERLGDEVHQALPLVEGAEPMGDDNLERLLNRNWRAALSVTGADGLPALGDAGNVLRNWRAALSVTGADGLPALGDAGNVLRPYTSLKLSLRLPPTVNGERATEAVREVLESDPPYGARVKFEADQAATGWSAPETAAWLDESCQAASEAVYGEPAMYTGEGGTIPFMAMLGEAFPDAQFLITGVLGPKSNAHGPNEFLHIPYARRLTACVAKVLADHGARR